MASDLELVGEGVAGWSQGLACGEHWGVLVCHAVIHAVVHSSILRSMRLPCLVGMDSIGPSIRIPLTLGNLLGRGGSMGCCGARNGGLGEKSMRRTPIRLARRCGLADTCG